VATNPWMQSESMMKTTDKIQSMNASPALKLAKLTELANKVDETLRPHYTCSKGCCGCCSINTLIYRYEAVRLSELTSRQMVDLPIRSRSRVLSVGKAAHGKQCVFVVDGACSVYENRPMICRLHHSFLKPIYCNAFANPGGLRTWARYNPDIIEIPYHILALSLRPREPWGSITEFFPS
jgi:Fe-S-cluster containining protein